MPQVSKIPVQKEVEKRMFELFWKSFQDLEKGEEMQSFLSDLLTKTERIMLAKRLSIALLLTKGYDYGSIKDILKVSSSTIGSIASWLDRSGEGYKLLVEKWLKEEKMKKFWEDVDRFLYRVGSTKRFFEKEEVVKVYHRRGRKPKLLLR